MATKIVLKNSILLRYLPGIVLFLTMACPVYSANFPLEIILPKAAGAGSPAIPSTYPIFRAYPGVEYNIRAAVIGGAYPYRFALTNQPSGMTINASTGEIVWRNPQSSSGNITLAVTDSEGATVSTSWTITVTTNGFLFVNSSYSGPQTGTIDQPFNSIASLLQNSGSGNGNDIVYFRAGNYQLIAFNSVYEATGVQGCNLDGRPHMWIGYPGEIVNINGDGRFFEITNLYFDRLNLSNFSDYGIRADSGSHYDLMRRCKLSNVTAVRSSNSNQGFYFTQATSTGYYWVFQDNEFSNFTGASAIGSIYDREKFLIENNYIHDPGGSGLNGVSNAIALKYRCNYGTVRGNIIRMSSGMILGNSLNGSFVHSNNNEICFNFFDAGVGGVHRFNTHGPTEPMLRTYYYRNTVIGDIIFQNINGSNCAAQGPFYLYNNVIINSTSSSYTKENHITYHYTCTDTPQNCISQSNNLTGTPENNIIDINGNLTPAYRSFLGTRGYQLGGKNGPMTPSSPKGLSISQAQY